jgi:hypothetical protein
MYFELLITSSNNFTELSPCLEASSCAATQELLNILCSRKVHYCAHKVPSPIPVLSKINAVHTTQDIF